MENEPQHLEFATRLLAWPAESEIWLDHVEACFASKGTPRSYFASHIDLSVDAENPTILVATHGSTIAATLRIFLLKYRFGGRSLSCGGIGEVCTAAAFRRRGLAGLLLAEARRRMQELQLSISALHAAPAYTEFYKRAGWDMVLEIPYATISLPPPNPSCGLRVRRAVPADVPALHSIWMDFTEGRLDGVQCRDLQRWRGWSWHELSERGTLFVAQAPDLSIVAYCSVEMRAGGVCVCRELGARNGLVDCGESALRETLTAAVRSLSGPRTEEVQCPALALRDWAMPPPSLPSLTDRGWLFCVVCGGAEARAALERAHGLAVCWRSDNF